MILLDTYIGYVIARFVAGKKTGERGRIKSVRFRIKHDYVFHIHHWFFSVLIIGALLLADVQSTLAYGFFAGSALHGLTYSDFYKIIHKEQKASMLSEKV